VLLGACKTSRTHFKGASNAITSSKPPITYLALGDSYTIGEMVEQQATFPFILANSITKKSSFEVISPTVIAKTGWRTDELILAIQVVQEKYDLVSVLIGVNNQYQGKEIEQFRAEFKVVLEKAIGFSKSGKRGVFVYSIPDYSVMPYMRGKDTDQVCAELKNYNAICSGVAKQMGISFYDITPISQKAQHDSKLVADDKLHPSGAMYKIWVSETVEQVISNQLSQ
jgi:lysophospholipase L1-like esterase